MDAIKVDLCGWWVVRWLMAKLTEAVKESLEYMRRSFGGVEEETLGAMSPVSCKVSVWTLYVWTLQEFKINMKL